MLTDFVVSSPKGKRDGSQGVGAKRKPLVCSRENMHPEGMREQQEASKRDLASLQDALI
jgi:hypothetical protein